MIKTCFECSTRHLPQDTVRLLDLAVDTGMTVCGTPVCEVPGHGFIMPIPAVIYGGCIEALPGLLRMAREQGCAWLMLDAEGEVLEGMPVYGRES